LNIDYISSERIKELIPGINPEGLRGGTFSPEDGNASPLLALNAFYRKAKNDGVEFSFKEQVSRIIHQNGEITGIMTSKGSINSSTVINAAGGNATELAKTISIDIPVIPDSHEAGITEPVKNFFSPMVVDIRPIDDTIWGGSKNYYFYQNKRGQVVFCLTPDPPIKGTDRRETAAFLPQISKRMVHLLPRLKNLKIRRTWRGLYPMTPDGIPIVGKVKDLEGYINTVGMCGQGYMLGPGLGEVIARLATDEYSPKDEEVLEEFSLYRNFDKVERLK
jgi:sarcosine oxidase subunit beta